MIDTLVRILEVAGAFIVVLGPLIVVHEFGHFILAKKLGIGVPVFSVGLGPRLFGFRRRETDYRVSAIPLGGFVRLMGDEADQDRTGAPEEFLSRPRYQRILVYLAGPAVNIVLALLLVWAVLMVYGVDELALPESYPVIVRVDPGSTAEASGVLAGDRLVSIAGRDARLAETYTEEVLMYPDRVKPVVVERDGERLALELQTGSDPKYRLGDPGWILLPEGQGASRIGEVMDGPARRAGILAGDEVIGVDDREPIGEAELRVLLAQSAGQELLLKIDRAGETVTIPVTPEARDGRGVIGVQIISSALVHREFGALEAAQHSLQVNLRQSKTLFLTLQRLIGRDISMRAFSGPIEIAQVSSQMVSGGLRTVLWFMAFISLQLGILNLMPIPVLDGGHILILGVESVMRRELSERLKERVMQFGLVFLLGFFGVIMCLDVIKATLSF